MRPNSIIMKEENEVTQDWRALTAFLKAFGDEAQARGREALSEEQKEGLRQLAAGLAGGRGAG